MGVAGVEGVFRRSVHFVFRAASFKYSIKFSQGTEFKRLGCPAVRISDSVYKIVE